MHEDDLENGHEDDFDRINVSPQGVRTNGFLRPFDPGPTKATLMWMAHGQLRTVVMELREIRWEYEKPRNMGQGFSFDNYRRGEPVVTITGKPWVDPPPKMTDPLIFGASAKP